MCVNVGNLVLYKRTRLLLKPDQYGTHDEDPTKMTVPLVSDLWIPFIIIVGILDLEYICTQTFFFAIKIKN